MTLEECYKSLGGDYDDVCKRMRKSSLVEKFVLRFLEDSTFASLSQALEYQNEDEAFRHAHTLKGMCQNLSFDRLYKSSVALNEALRNHEREKYDELFIKVHADYIQTIDAIRDFQASKE